MDDLLVLTADTVLSGRIPLGRQPDLDDGRVMHGGPSNRHRSRPGGVRCTHSPPSGHAASASVRRVISAGRSDDVARFHSLLRTAVTEDAQPLSPLRRQARVGTVGELVEHLPGTVRT